MQFSDYFSEIGYVNVQLVGRFPAGCSEHRARLWTDGRWSTCRSSWRQ